MIYNYPQVSKQLISKTKWSPPEDMHLWILHKRIWCQWWCRKEEQRGMHLKEGTATLVVFLIGTSLHIGVCSLPPARRQGMGVRSRTDSDIPIESRTHHVKIGTTANRMKSHPIVIGTETNRTKSNSIGEGFDGSNMKRARIKRKHIQSVRHLKGVNWRERK
jgi:hypothetical protein